MAGLTSENNMSVAELVELQSEEEEKKKILSIFKDESAKCDMWTRKYIANSMYVLGAGAYGSVFQVTTRQYKTKQKLSKSRHSYHPAFLEAMAAQRRVKTDMLDKLRDPTRDDDFLDIVAIKYEVVDQAQLEDGTTRFCVFLRREFLVMDTLWRKNPRQMHGFPVVFDFGYIGDKMHYGINQKYKNIFTYLNIEGEEVKFFTDINNRNLEGVTKISYMSMELLGPSIDDLRDLYEPWFKDSKMNTFFNVSTVFKIADQLLCRLYILHKCGFVHHDLKPDNIAMGNGKAMNTLYLLDFGFAKQLSNGKPNEWMGSRKFISVDTYNYAKPNFAQDIESWFYVIVNLLYDALPWSDEFISPMMDENADEMAKWAVVINIKKTWWGDMAEATTLKEIMSDIAALHQEVPDMKAIMEQLYKRVRDLRNSMRAMDDAQTLHCELGNNQSNIFKSYMSIRKVLLHIFHLPNITKNQFLGDAELKALQENRAEKQYPLFIWESKNYDWEWDEYFDRCWNSQTGEVPNVANQHSSWGAPRRLPQGSLFTANYSKPARTDEISYIYDPARKSLVSKENGRQKLHMGPNEQLRLLRDGILTTSF